MRRVPASPGTEYAPRQGDCVGDIQPQEALHEQFDPTYRAIRRSLLPTTLTHLVSLYYTNETKVLLKLPRESSLCGKANTVLTEKILTSGV